MSYQARQMEPVMAWMKRLDKKWESKEIKETKMIHYVGKFEVANQ